MRTNRPALRVISTIVVLVALPPALAADPPEPKFRHQTIDDKIQIGYGVAAADVDGDKRIDILVADKTQFVWYRNPTWEKFVIAENLTKRDNVCLAAQDLDGDGKCELAVGGDWAPNDRETSGAVFYMIAPEDRTQKWEAVKLHAEPTVHRMKWVKKDAEWGLLVIPLHGRANASGGDAGARTLFYDRPADPHSEWKTELIDDTMHMAHGFMPTLAGGFIAGREGVRVVGREAGKWSSRLISGVPHPCGEVRLGFVNAGPEAGEMTVMATVEPMHGHQLVVYVERPQPPGGLTRHVLTEKLVEGHALGVIRRGLSDDLVVGWRGRGKGTSVGVSVWAVEDAGAPRWREHVVDDGMACEDLCTADLDADGDLDIVASGRATKNVKIYWNETPSAASTKSTNPP